MEIWHIKAVLKLTYFPKRSHSEQMCQMSDVYDGLRLRTFDDGVMWAIALIFS
ncbi:hypothetical protein H6G93_08615 [Nostoc sp. FACHB-973]|nr:hypothetical protein [Nostoc sp. FACHB-973]